MIDLVCEQWTVLETLCRQFGVKRIDMLTGFIGKGASTALASLNVRARIIIGLPNDHAALSQVQIDEIVALQAHHDVRWLPGLHAKLYLLDERVVIVGSANFTRSGFEHLDELAIATDEPTTTAQAVKAFETRFAQAARIEPERLEVLPATMPDGADGLRGGLGVAREARRSGFTSAPLESASTHATSMSADSPEVYDHDDATIEIDFDRDGFMYMNIAEGPHRCWADCRRYGFLSAGQSARWSNQLTRLTIGAPIYAYFKSHGYLGLGIVEGSPRMASDHVVPSLGRKLFELPLLQPGIMTNAGNPADCEWVVPVRWYRTRAVHEAVGYGLFSSQLVACRLRDPATLRTLRSAFERA